jgi:hypothetical protein
MVLWSSSQIDYILYIQIVHAILYSMLAALLTVELNHGEKSMVDKQLMS